MITWSPILGAGGGGYDGQEDGCGSSAANRATARIHLERGEGLAISESQLGAADFIRLQNDGHLVLVYNDSKLNRMPLTVFDFHRRRQEPIPTNGTSSIRRRHGGVSIRDPDERWQGSHRLYVRITHRHQSCDLRRADDSGAGDIESCRARTDAQRQMERVR